MSTPVSSIAVANEFIMLGKENNKVFTVMQILKLVYIAHGWMLGFFDESLTDDDVEAWRYGPVIPNLYGAIRHYKGRPVTESISTFSDEEIFLDEEQRQIITFVYQRYANFSGKQLSNLTHQVGTPWYCFYNKNTEGRRIPTATIARHYKEKVDDLIKEMKAKHDK